MLSLCGRVAKSAVHWKTSYTVLLLSNPGCRSEKQPIICVNSNTHIDVDPIMDDAAWLRSFAQRLTTREPVNIPFPRGGMSELTPSTHYLLKLTTVVFDVHAAAKAPDRVLFTLFDLDQ